MNQIHSLGTQSQPPKILIVVGCCCSATVQQRRVLEEAGAKESPAAWRHRRPMDRVP